MCVYRQQQQIFQTWLIIGKRYPPCTGTLVSSLERFWSLSALEKQCGDDGLSFIRICLLLLLCVTFSFCVGVRIPVPVPVPIHFSIRPVCRFFFLLCFLFWSHARLFFPFPFPSYFLLACIYLFLLHFLFFLCFFFSFLFFLLLFFFS